MVKCNGCRYLDGYVEYGQEYIYCTNSMLKDDNVDPEFNGTEKDHNCPHWQSIYQQEPHEFYMWIFSQMLERLGM